MKKIFATLAILGAMTFGLTSNVLAQDDEFFQEESEQVVEEAAEAAPAAEEVAPAAAPAAAPVAAPAAPAQEQPAVEEEVSMFKALKIKFIEGDAFFMSFVALCLIIGLALCIERIIYLSLAATNTKKLLEKVEAALDERDPEKAKEICRNTRGPIASIMYQGLMRIDEGADVVEKTVVSYGGVQMGALEKNVTWISLCIALAPMLGFMGTVIGMIQAFDKIQQVGDISATVVAGGIKVALLTTVFGLIVGMILQVFLNFILTRIEALTTEMEDSSISLLDLIVKYDATK
ncbi:MAG: MotA/TolQ/ExbB proton channel family protein [Paludibacteraceae bacterium]|nr:MotA/TolQ/ExbB proton channel family protein [Bacteroidales bacterium]MBO5133295.1 MotA/TolQ/ExbB proton channel family protein [Paludibacteraceae bacterium]MBQ9100710.1 MotA/TolQ/ExbB proton channel family protein [Paludibacteraceae bacterium]MBR6658486.1 MotA/TolQ/ExbB proton channel family protein [Paludibacteraceae bacterium]